VSRRWRAAALILAATSLYACQPVPDHLSMVPRDDLVSACLGFDMLTAARKVVGDTLAIDRGTGEVVDELTRAGAEAACATVEEQG